MKRPKEAGGKVFISVGTDGHVKASEGYLTAEDAKKIQAILTGADEKSMIGLSHRPSQKCQGR